MTDEFKKEFDNLNEELVNKKKRRSVYSLSDPKKIQVERL